MRLMGESLIQTTGQVIVSSGTPLNELQRPMIINQSGLAPPSSMLQGSSLQGHLQVMGLFQQDLSQLQNGVHNGS